MVTGSWHFLSRGIEHRFHGLSARSLVPILTELSRPRTDFTKTMHKNTLVPLCVTLLLLLFQGVLVASYIRFYFFNYVVHMNKRCRDFYEFTHFQSPPPPPGTHWMAVQAPELGLDVVERAIICAPAREGGMIVSGVRYQSTNQSCSWLRY
jgi:hypothetical protein